MPVGRQLKMLTGFFVDNLGAEVLGPGLTQPDHVEGCGYVRHSSKLTFEKIRFRISGELVGRALSNRHLVV